MLYNHVVDWVILCMTIFFTQLMRVVILALILPKTELRIFLIFSYFITQRRMKRHELIMHVLVMNNTSM